jgi:tRNA U34 5-carboxymethylaminomethyl modifying enzyme MnmG/GidA
MPSNSIRQVRALSDAQLNQFVQDGFVRLDGAFPEQLAEEEARAVFTEPMRREYQLIELLRRPRIDYEYLLRLLGEPLTVDMVVAEQITIQAK